MALQVERALGPSCPCVLCISALAGTVSTPQNLAKEGARSATISVLFCYIKTILTHGTVFTSPNLAKARARRASNDCRATRCLFS